MKWGSFGLIHIGSLILSCGIVVGLYALLRNRSKRVQAGVLFLLTLPGLVSMVVNLVMWGSPVEYLPLHLCALMTLVLPFAVLTRSAPINNMMLLWSLGAVLALVVNTAQADYTLGSLAFVLYYFPHTFQCAVVVLMFKLGLVKRDVRQIPFTLGVTVAAYTLVHGCNVCINQQLEAMGSAIRVNYMYSVQPANPVLELFWQLVPHPYWYMFLALPVIGAYLLLVYAPLLRKGKQKEQRTTLPG